MYPDPAEKLPKTPNTTSRMRSSKALSSETTAALDALKLSHAGNRLETAVQAAAAGASLTEIEQAIRSHTNPAVMTVKPIRAFRLSESFENLRQNARRYQEDTGTAPRIFLANVGSYRARAGFTTTFFEVSGFEIVDQGAHTSAETAAQAALISSAPVVVICSTDDRYPEIVPPLVKHIKAEKPDTIVILAGYPEDQIAAHRASGVDDFIHVRSNCYEMNLKVQRLIGASA